MSASAEAEIESREVPTKVGRLRVEVRGAGPAVLCWPSLYCDARTLDPLALALAEDHRVVVVNGPGHGGSGRSPGTFSMDDCAEAALGILDVLGIRDATWIGAAWGGQVGVAAARRHPDRVTGLVILNTPMAPWRGSRLVLTRVTYALLSIFGPRSFLAPMIAGAMIAKNVGSGRARIVATVADALRRCDKQGLLRAARFAMFERGDMVPLLPQVRVPALFFAGAEDALFPVAQAREEASRIPRCRFVVVERSSHQSALEAPEQVIPIVREEIAAWRAAAAREGAVAR